MRHSKLLLDNLRNRFKKQEGLWRRSVPRPTKYRGDAANSKRGTRRSRASHKKRGDATASSKNARGGKSGGEEGPTIRDLRGKKLGVKHDLFHGQVPGRRRYTGPEKDHKKSAQEGTRVRMREGRGGRFFLDEIRSTGEEGAG